MIISRPIASSVDGQWSEGLISAARLVAAATHSLVEAAQHLVQGVGTEETLISAAKQVASCTAQLLIACKVKSDPNSESGRRLQSAGNAVIKSTDNLVRAAQKAIDMEEETILKINTSMVDGMAQEINARSDVLKMERQLEDARNKLIAIRQAKYKQRVAAGLATDDSDTEGGLNMSGGQYGYQSSSPVQYNTINRSYNNTPTSPPSFHNTSTSTTYQQITPQQQHRNQTTVQRTFNTTSTLPNPNVTTTTSTTTNSLKRNTNKDNLEACVQDLHEKTFGKSGLMPAMSTFKYTTLDNSTNASNHNNNVGGNTANGQNYEGFTTR